MLVTLGNVAPLEPDGSAAECGETVTVFEIPHDDPAVALKDIRDAWPRHSSSPPSFVSGDQSVCELVADEFGCEVREG
jgi:hypothetical protein